MFIVDDILLFSAIFLAGQVLSALTTKIGDAPPPAGIGDFNFPTANENRVIPIVTGTVKQAGPNVVWYGDLRIKAKQEKVKTSLFSHKHVTVGYYYYLGLQFALAKGPCTLKKIWVGDKLIWSGTQSAEGDIELNLPPDPLGDKKLPSWLLPFYQLFHPKVDADYNNPPSGILRFYPGNETQTADPYLSGFQTLCPGYRGTCYVVFNGYLGESPNIEPWSFEIERIPNGLSLGDPTVNTVDANIMNRAYELFTDVYGYTGSDIDTAGWTAAATTLASEDNGLSMTEDTARQATEVLRVLERQANCHFYLDPVSGKWKVELIRNDYNVDDVVVLDESNVTRVLEFDRGTWSGTTNLVKVEFANRDNEYRSSSAIAQDIANATIQGQRVPTTISLPGVKNADLANNLAWREIRSLSFPLASARILANRTLWNVHVGQPMLFFYNELVSTPIPMRVIRINLGGPSNEDIEIDLIQDVYSDVTGSFAAPTTAWVEPATGLTELDVAKVMEAPYALTRRDAESGEHARVWLAAESVYRGEIGYQIWVDADAVGYAEHGSIYGFAVRATLDGNITQDDTTITITTPVEAEAFFAATEEDVGQNLTNLILIGDELIAPLSVANTADGLELIDCLRGLCDTAEAEHADETVVWLLCLGSGLGQTPVTPDDADLDVKLLPFSPDATMEIGDVSAIELTLQQRTLRPYPPSNMELNSSQYPSSVAIDSGVVVEFNRRDFRIYDETSQLDVDAATLVGDFPTNNTTQYRLHLQDGATIKYSLDWNDGSASFASIGRATIIRYFDGLPTEMTLSIATRHTYESVVYEALQNLEDTVAVTSGLTGDEYLGTLDTLETSLPWTAPTTGTYAFTLDSVLAGDVYAKINGGAFASIITAGNLTGNLVGVTAGDIIEIRHDDSSSSGEVLIAIDSPSSDDDAFAVFYFDNTYGTTYGGFGRAGFGTGPFGR